MHRQHHVRTFPRLKQVYLSQGSHRQRQNLSNDSALSIVSRRAIVSKNSRFFVAAGIAIVIGAAGRVTPASPQTTPPYQPPAKRVSPAEGFARQKSSLPTPRA